MFKKILILNVHDDDAVFSFGGLMAKANRKGDELFCHTFCMGGPRSNVPIATRVNEYEQVMNYFHVTATYDPGYDGLLDKRPNCDITAQIDEIISDLKPDEVYCSPDSEHADHHALYRAFLASCRLKSGWQPKLCAVGTYMFSDQLYNPTYGGKIFQPLTEEDYQRKLTAYKMEKSQFKPKPSPLGEDGLRIMSEYYGMLCGHKYAELYYQLKYIRSI